MDDKAMTREAAAVFPELGDRVKDRVSGREGVVIGSADYLYGTGQSLVVLDDAEAKDGIPLGTWVEDNRLDVLDKDA